ncbi:MAG: YqiA/YcfP family alpha/beta fold hydrolase [Gammaproteobacteria bacterium]|jgi:predicted esterase YcpF (UPF0227 family)
MNHILYLHGFASSSDSTKAKLFKTFIQKSKEFVVLVPDLPNNLIGWSSVIEELVKEYNPVAFVGSSLGGFYASFYARKFEAIDILLNPAVLPAKGMKVYLGKNTNYSTGEEFELTNADIDHLANMEKNIGSVKLSCNRSMVVVETGDELLDYKNAVDFYAGAQIRVIKGGSHSLDSFEDQLDKISSFINNALN